MHTIIAHSDRGSNENNNKLIRRFIPKGYNIVKVSKKEVRRIESFMNNLPQVMFNKNDV